MSEGQNGHRPINAAEFLQQRVTSLQAENADLIRDLEIAESDLDMAHARMRDFRRLTRLQNERQDDGPFATPKFSLRGLDLSKLRPVSFAWRPWMVMGAYNEILGEEGIGKGTLTAYIVAGITTGTLTGDLEGQPRDVLYIGADEDDWEEAVGPRLHRAGANLSRVVELHSDHGESFNLVDHADDLDRVLQHKGREFGLVVVEQVLDVLPYLRNPNDPMAIRHATKPRRAILRDRRVTGLAARHVNKA